LAFQIYGKQLVEQLLARFAAHGEPAAP